MKLIFLYGPPAVGKLTVAQELQKRIDYKLLHNHQLLNIIKDIFGYDHPVRRPLGRELRLRLFEEVAKADVNLITTFGAAGPKYFDFFDDVVNIIGKHGGKILFVQLLADKETLLGRVSNDSRVKRNKLTDKNKLQDTLDNYPNTFDKYPKIEHLTIDTSKTSPENAAKEIIKYYKL